MGSSYLEYLNSIPVGAKMRVELSAEPPGTLSEDDELELFFTVTKVGDDGWKGLKGAADDVVSTTVELHSNTTHGVTHPVTHLSCVTRCVGAYTVCRASEVCRGN